MKKWILYIMLMATVMLAGGLIHAEAEKQQENLPLRIKPVWTDVKGERAQEGYYQSRKCEFQIEPATVVTGQALKLHGLKERYMYHEEGKWELKSAGIVDEEFVIDHTKPEIEGVEVSGSGIRVMVKDEYFNPDVSTIYAQGKQVTKECSLKWKREGKRWIGSGELEGEGEYTRLLIRVFDLAGNETNKNEECHILIDTTGPEISVNMATGIYKKSQYLIIWARDSLSGTKKIEYRINGGEWIEYNEKVLLMDNRESVLDIRAEDQSGNISLISGTTVDIDTKRPLIHVTTESKKKNGIYIEQPVLKIMFDDNCEGGYQSGISKAYASIVYEDHTRKEYVFSSRDELLRIPIHKKEERVKVQIICQDRAGNQSDVSFDVDIDMRSPRIQVALPHKVHEFYGMDVNARICIQDSNASTMGTTIFLDGKRQYVHWNEREGELQAEITCTKEGKHQLRVQSRDCAGNVGDDNEVSFTIDKTVPVMMIQGQPKNYTNRNVDMVIKVRDENCDLHSVEECVQIRRENVWENTRISWSKERNLWTGSIQLEKEGKYTISGSCMDKAGWESNILYESFVLDKTKPSIQAPDASQKILDENARKPYWSAKDPNNNPSAYKLLLCCNGRSIVSEKKFSQWEDGAYTWTYYAWDKAGNMAKRNGSFVLNRHGSMVAETDYTRALSRRTVGQVKEPLIFYEKNPTPLLHYQVKAFINGKTKKLVSYGNGSGTIAQKEWKKGGAYYYEICIPKENFREEGVYRIHLESKDSCQHVYRRKMVFEVKHGESIDIIEKTGDKEQKQLKLAPVLVLILLIMGALWFLRKKRSGKH